MDLGLSFSKYLVFLFNFFFFVGGIAIAGVGILLKLKLLHYDAFFDAFLTYIPYVLILLGVVILFIAFLACCGSITENTCMLFSFAVIMITILLTEVGIGIYVNEKRGQLDEIVEKSLNDTLLRIKDDKGFYVPWHFLQCEFKCCGVREADDWKAVNDTIYLPPSCCGKTSIDDVSTCIKTEAYTTGCKEASIDFLNKNVPILVGIGAGIVVFQLISAILACCMFSVYRRK